MQACNIDISLQCIATTQNHTCVEMRPSLCIDIDVYVYVILKSITLSVCGIYIKTTLITGSLISRHQGVVTALVVVVIIQGFGAILLFCTGEVICAVLLPK